MLQVNWLFDFVSHGCETSVRPHASGASLLSECTEMSWNIGVLCVCLCVWVGVFEFVPCALYLCPHLALLSSPFCQLFYALFFHMLFFPLPCSISFMLPIYARNKKRQKKWSECTVYSIRKLKLKYLCVHNFSQILFFQHCCLNKNKHI